MKYQSSLFIIFCLCLTAVLMMTYALFVGHFDGHEIYEHRVNSLKTEVHEQKFRNAMLFNQLRDFQQTVAAVLPENKNLKEHRELAQFAASLRIPASEDQLDLSPVLFEKGKKLFNSRKYEDAIREFSTMLEKFPLTKHKVEAQFFIAESYFQRKDFRSSLNVIDGMVTQYPDNDMTGFILLRMGQISEINGQSEEAAEIYKTVMKNFKNEELKKQAKKLVQSVEYQ